MIVAGLFRVHPTTPLSKQHLPPTSTATANENDENATIATALLAANLDYNSDETMRYEARKRLKTAAEGSLNVDHGKNICLKCLSVSIRRCLGAAG